MLRTATLITLVAAAFGLAACDSLTSPGDQARVTVLLTDAPNPYLESAVVKIGRIEIIPAGGPPRVIAPEGGTYDLLELQDGVTAELGSEYIEPGRYLQLRMIVEKVTITLKNDYKFTDGEHEREIKVPSGAQTGIKVNLQGVDDYGAGVEIRPGETFLVVDFDVFQNFVMQGDPDTAAGIKDFLFTPTLRAVVEDVAGSIAGEVTAPDDVDTEGLVVTATPADAENGEPVATTLVKEDGTFKIHFVAPGSYDVTVAFPIDSDTGEREAEWDGYVATVVSVEVTPSEDVTDIEVEISLED